MPRVPSRNLAYLALSVGMITIGYFGLNGALENSLALTTALLIAIVRVSIDLGCQLTQFETR